MLRSLAAAPVLWLTLRAWEQLAVVTCDCVLLPPMHVQWRVPPGRWSPCVCVFTLQLACHRGRRPELSPMLPSEGCFAAPLPSFLELRAHGTSRHAPPRTLAKWRRTLGLGSFMSGVGHVQAELAVAVCGTSQLGLFLSARCCRCCFLSVKRLSESIIIQMLMRL